MPLQVFDKYVLLFRDDSESRTKLNDFMLARYLLLSCRLIFFLAVLANWRVAAIAVLVVTDIGIAFFVAIFVIGDVSSFPSMAKDMILEEHFSVDASIMYNLKQSLFDHSHPLTACVLYLLHMANAICMCAFFSGQGGRGQREGEGEPAATRGKDDRKSEFEHLCQLSNRKALKKFIKDVDGRDLVGFRALHVAVHCGNVLATRLLLEKNGIDVMAKDEHGASVWRLAVERRRPEVLSEIVKSKKWKVEANEVIECFTLALKTSRDCSKVLAGHLASRERQILLPRGLSAAELDFLRPSWPRSNASKRSEDTRVKFLLKRLESKGQVRTSRTGLQDIQELLECPICMQSLIPSADGQDVRILACPNDHWLCRDCCSGGQLRQCPICRVHLDKQPLKRRITGEKIVQAVFKMIKEKEQD